MIRLESRRAMQYQRFDAISSRPCVVAVMLAVLLAATPRAAAGESPRVHVVLTDAAGMPPRVRQEARREVTRIFADAGIAVVWATGQPAPDGTHLTVVITNWEPGTSIGGGVVLGLTMKREDGRRNTHAYVLWRRVLAKAQRFGVNLSNLLAAAIAHELGHMLLRQGSHGGGQLMGAQWGYHDVRAIAAGRLRFSRESAQAMRLALTSAARARSSADSR